MCLFAECPVGHYLQPTETESRCLQPNNESQYLLPNREIAYRCVNQCNYTSTRVDGDDFCYGNIIVVIIILMNKLKWSGSL